MGDQQTAGTAAGPADADGTPLHRLARLLALAGGVLLIGAALLVCVSVALRAVTTSGLPGDYESVQMAMALVAFTFFPYCQLRAGHILVETFTGWMGQTARSRLDAFWDVATAGFAGLMTWRLAIGAFETISNGTTTMVIGLPVGWAIAAVTVMTAVWTLTALASAARRLRWPR